MPRRRRRHPNWPARLVIGGLLLVAAAMLLLPAAYEYQRLTKLGLDASFGKLVEQQSARLFGVVWFAFLGASVGSFLNVVVWRVPRGRSLFGRSHCPWCTVQIQGRDNFPVLGWLLLRARCRACRLPISARYPCVELLMAVIFLLVLVVELLSGGANLPLRVISLRRGMLETVFTPQKELLSLYAFHMWMLFHLVGWSLMRWDGQRVPLGYLVFCLICPIAAGIAFPWLHPVPAFAGPLETIANSPHWNRMLTGAVGAAMGALLGNELDLAWSRQRPQAAWFLAVSGAHLGWQAAFGVACIATFFMAGATLWQRAAPQERKWPIGSFLTFATLAQLIFWRQTVEQLSWWPGPHASVQRIALIGLALVLVQFSLRWVAGNHTPHPAEAA